MGTVTIDTSQVRAFATRLASAPARKQRLVAAAVKKGAQNVKTAVRADVAGSSNAGFRAIPIAYEMRSQGVLVEADVAPTRGGAGSLANIAFFGTSRGGGTHRFYEHAEAEMDALAHYVHEAARGL